MPKLEAVTEPPPADSGPESKRDRFIRVANLRVNNIIHSFEVLDGMARNANNYEFDQADCDRIIDAITAELNKLKERLQPPGKRVSKRFELV